jgi:hypothetical protein
MHSRIVSITAIAVISFLPILWKTNANATDPYDGQAILIECPVWGWEPSPILGVEYELCFDDIDHCTVAKIGDSVCIPSMGVHNVWVTAIDNRSGEPIYYDGDIVPIERVNSADFTGDGAVGILDLGLFDRYYGGTNGGPGDLDGDGVVGFPDYGQFLLAIGKCVDASGALYVPC